MDVAAVQYAGWRDRHREPFARSVAEFVDVMLPEVMGSRGYRILLSLRA
jgi:hypothetical protein